MIQQEHDKNQQGIPLDVYTKSKIFSTAKVAGVAALLSISGTIVSLIAYIIKPSPVKAGLAKEGFDDTTVQMAAGGSALFVAFSVVVSAVLFYMLYNFSRFTRKGLEADDCGVLNKGLFNLAAYFRIIGIILLCSLAFMFLSSLMMGLGATV